MTDFKDAGGDYKRSEESENNTQNNTAEPSPQQQQQQPSTANVLAHINANKIDSLMLATRLLTILFTITYILPIFGNQESAFSRVLLANSATSAFRLHQRLPAFTLSREFLARLLSEDSCHYLIFSLVVYSVQPTLLILMPVTLFAILHAASYSLKLLDIIGQNSWWGARFLISLVEFQAANILKAVAFSEIFIMPLCILYTFLGRAGLMTPFMYYHFLVMRYTSRRNPHTRNAFSELRMVAESFAARSPAIVQKMVYAGIALVVRLAPQMQAVPPTAQ